MNLDGKNFTNFPNLRVKGDGNAGPGAVRFASNSSFEQVLQGNATYTDADKTITMPAKTGSVGVSGTFTVNLPAITAAQTYSTNVTVSGIRTEDAVVCAVQNTFTTTTLSDHANNGVGVLIGCSAGNGGVNLTFVNPTATATIYEDLVLGYTAVR